MGLERPPEVPGRSSSLTQVIAQKGLVLFTMVMIENTIIVPLDGSEFAEKAISVALSILKGKQDPKLVLLRALEAPRFGGWLPAEMVDVERREGDAVGQYLSQKREHILEGLVESPEGEAIAVETRVARGLSPVQAVVEACEASNASLVVMSSHGRGGWFAGLLGSNAEKILRLSPSQVLVLKPKANQEYDENFAFGSILIPLDGSKRAEKAIPHALDLGPSGQAKIILLGVSVVFQGHALENDLLTVVNPDLEKIENYLESQAQWVRKLGYTVEVRVRRGKPGPEIVEAGEENGVDLILLMSKKHEGLGSRIFGGVSEHVIRHGERSVLALKPLED